MTRRRHRRPRVRPTSSTPAPAPASVAPLDDEVILPEILLRLPPLPSSLPRAALVCKRWRRLVSDAHFIRRFRDHHGKPPLLGFFSLDSDLNVAFAPALDRVPAARFSLRLDGAAIHCKILGCRHGRVLILNMEFFYLLVWDPIAGDQRRVDFPPTFRGRDKKFVTNGAVACAAVGKQGHVHGGCHSSPFKVVLLGRNRNGIFACAYSSESGSWGNEALLLWPQNITGISSDCPSALVGSSICWLLTGTRFAILQFDLYRQSLAAIEFPSNVIGFDEFIRCECQFLITPADNGGLNFLVLSGFTARVWKCKTRCDGVVGWVLDLNNLLTLKAGVDTRPPKLLGLAEDDNAMFLWTDVGIFMLHLESLKLNKLSVILDHSYHAHHPFSGFYSAGHIAEGSHRLNINSSEPIKGTISSVSGSESAPSGMEIGVETREASMVNSNKSLFGAPSIELDKEQTGLSNEGDDRENLIPRMAEPEAPACIAGVQGTHRERSGSQNPDVNCISRSSAVPPTLASEKINSTVFEMIEAFMEFRKQHKPAQEFSIAECINAMRQMSNLSDEEKVMSCDLFRDFTNREIFLSLNGTLRTMWLKKQLTKI